MFVCLWEQGLRSVLKRVPAEETIECQKHERGESMREGTAPPRVRGVLGLSPEKVLNF